MEESRRAFFSTIESIRGVLDEPYLQDKDPVSRQDNASARLMRNGLCVILFSQLEEYITNIARSALRDISRSSVSYDDLPKFLRETLTIKAMRGILNSYSLDKDSEEATKLSFVKEEIGRVSSFGSNPRNFSGYGFNHSGSNLYADDIKDFFKCFSVEDGWGKLSSIASALGASRPSLRDDFLNYARMRHTAAHKASADVPYSDLENMLDGVCIIGIAFDFFARMAVSYLVQSRSIEDFNSSMGYPRFDVQKLFFDGHVYLETRVSTESYRLARETKVIKRYISRVDAVKGAVSRSSADCVTVHDRRGMPVEFVAG